MNPRRLFPIYRMSMIDVINECTDRLTVLERVKPIRKGDPRTTTVFDVEYAIHQFVYSPATPTREEHVEVLLLDIEHGDIKSMRIVEHVDALDGMSSFAHTLLVQLRLLCKEWKIAEWAPRGN